MSHDKIASTFDAWVKSGEADELEDEHSNVGRQVIEGIQISAGNQTLDLGCGTGWATRLLANGAPGSSAIGVDVAQEMISRAESLHDFTFRARYELGTFEKLDFPDDRFHHVFSMEAIYYAVDLDQALAEVLRVMRSGATADFVIDFYSDSRHTGRWADVIGLDMHYLGTDEWASRFEKAGFTNVKTERVIDSRGPGTEAEFVPDVHTPDWRAKVEIHEAGSLWIHAEKP